MESAHHFSSKPDCNSPAEVPSLILRTALSTIPFCLGAVRRYNLHDPFGDFRIKSPRLHLVLVEHEPCRAQISHADCDVTLCQPVAD